MNQADPAKNGAMQKIKSLPAGLEIDAMVARSLMGLSAGGAIPPYSTDIAVAWTVVEKMVRMDGLYFGAPHYKNKRQSLASLGYPEGTECWYCVINTKILNKVVVCAETAPLAICRTALLWVQSLADQAAPNP
jgi:hypothetical protein